MTKQLVAIGECMIEMAGGGDGLWRMGFAGDTYNTIWYARAGLDPADGPLLYASAVGDDTFSGRMLAAMRDGGIDTTFVRRIEGGRPGLYLIEQKEGDRAFTYWRETAAARRLADDPAWLEEATADAGALYFSGITLAILPPEGRERLLAIAARRRAEGAMVAFDPNIRPALWPDARTLRDAIAGGAAAASLVLPSFDDETTAFGDAAPGATIARYRAAGTGEVVVKNGAGAITLAGEVGGPVEIPAAEDVTVVDATAAGDSFNGAYIAARLRGAEAREAAEAGRDLAATVVGARGAILDTAGMERWRAIEG